MKRVMTRCTAVVLLVLVSQIPGCEPNDPGAGDGRTAHTPSDSSQPKDLGRGFVVEVGQMAPDVTLLYQDGRRQSLKDLRGQVVMLQFTASWCGVCVREMPVIESEIWLPHKDKGLAVIGIDRGEPLVIVQEFVKTTGITYPLTLNEDMKIYTQFAAANSGVTRNVIIDQQGKIAFLTRLFDRQEFNEMKEVIQELLSTPASG